MRVWLRKARRKLGLSQQEVADILNLTRQSYGMIENGDRQADMSLSVITGLAKAFKVPLERIIEEELEFQNAGKSQEKNTA